MNKQVFQVDLNVLEKYNQPGPRYTSYPTAVHFNSDFNEQSFIREIKSSNTGDKMTDISLYFHFPFCHELCFFCACNMIVTHNPVRVERYLDRLKREIELIGSYIHPDRKVVQMHWGGGTPTYLTPDQLRDIYNHINGHFNFSEDAEISIEIDPRTVGDNRLSILKELGFNRVSFGLQDFNPLVQKEVNRIQTYEQNAFVIEESRRLSFDSINVDLMYGLPHQTITSYKDTLDKVLSFSPDRLAVFNYAHVPWLKKHQAVLPNDVMPGTSERLNILKHVIERLTGAGYVYIGMDHFARPDDELSLAMANRTLYRNFQGYSTRANTEIYALGMSSISQLESAYAQNLKSVKEYEQRIDAGLPATHLGVKLTAEDQLRRYVINEIMCNNRIVKTEVERRFKISFDDHFNGIMPDLDVFIDDGLVEVSTEKIEVPNEGRLVVRNIAMVFDAYLKADLQKPTPTYSRTV